MKKALVLALAATTLACVDNNVSLQWEAVCAVPDTCQFSSSNCDQVYIGAPALDVARTTEMLLFLQMRNQLATNASADAGQLNTHDATVTEYKIEYDAPFALQDVTDPPHGTAVIPASTTSVLTVSPIPTGIGSALRLLVPASVPAAPLYVNVTARIRAVGEYADKSSFETAQYEIPIRVCNGCLGTFSICQDGTPTRVCPQDGQLPASQIDCN